MIVDYGTVILLFVFVCQAVLGGQMKVFCLFGWGMVGWSELFQGKMMAFWTFLRFLACWLVV